jgi:uncharacterized membrane protein
MKRLLPVMFVTLLLFFAVRPLFSDGFFPMHDDTQVARVVEMGRALKEGQFPVRWVSDLGYGYGYPIFNFYGPLPYYVGGILYAMGVSGLLATKIMFGLGIILPSILLYGTTVGLLGWPAAATAALFLAYAPYHAVQIYVRGAIGEYWIIIFWPLILYALVWLHDSKRRALAIALGAIGIAGSVLSHTLMGYVTALIFGIGICLYWIWSLLMKRKAIMAYGVILCLGLGLSAFFWLPAIFEMKFTDVAAQVSATANYHDHFVCLVQLWSSAWGFGGSSAGCVRDGLSFMLGKIHILVALLAVVGLIARRKQSTDLTYRILAVATACIGIFFTLQVSESLWNVIPEFSYLQYPWRFLSLASFGLSLLAGCAINMAKRSGTRVLIAGICITAVIYMNAKWFTPQYSYVKDAKTFETNEALRWKASAISDEYLPPQLVRPTEENMVVSDTIVSPVLIHVTPVVSTAADKRFLVESTRSAMLTIQTAYFPGWQYSVNARAVQPEIHNGLPEIRIEAGKNLVEWHFTNTPVRTAGNSITVISCIVGIILYVKQRKTIG